MTVNVELSLPKADDQLAVKTWPTNLFNLPRLSPAHGLQGSFREAFIVTESVQMCY